MNQIGKQYNHTINIATKDRNFSLDYACNDYGILNDFFTMFEVRDLTFNVGDDKEYKKIAIRLDSIEEYYIS